MLRYSKIFVFLLCLWPLYSIIYGIFYNNLGAEPVDKIINHFLALDALEDNANIKNTALQDLKLDSLEFMELILEIEEDLNISIGDDSIDPEMSVSSFAASVIANIDKT